MLAVGVLASDIELFKQNFAALDQWMRAQGFFNFAQEGTDVTEAGAMKKACVECGRSRPEVLYDLDTDLLKSWVAAYTNPRDAVGGASSLGDRKVCPMHQESALSLRTEYSMAHVILRRHFPGLSKGGRGTKDGLGVACP